MPFYTNNEIRINQCIVDIFTEGLIENFIENNMENNIDTTDITIDEYLRDEVIENIFNRETCNILNYWNKKYTLDFETSIELLKYIKEDLADNDLQDLFCDMFDREVNSETKIINMCCYVWIRAEYMWIDSHCCDSDYTSITYDCKKMDKMIGLYTNYWKFEAHKKKHSLLIYLYNKLDKLNKKKIVINKILNDKFDTDILQNIIEFYK